MNVIHVLVALLASVVNAESVREIHILDECPSYTEPFPVQSHCIPENVEVTHLLQDNSFRFTAICGDKSCPSKNGECPIGFVDGQYGKICNCKSPGLHCPSYAPSVGPEIAPRVLATLIG